MANKITDQQRELMFQAFCEKQSLRFVAQKCTVNVGTVKKYREMDNWDRRYSAITERAKRKVDNKAVKRRERWAKQGQALQQVGTRKFYDKDGNIKQKVVDDMGAGDGIRAIAEGVRIEREALGDDGQGLTITVSLPPDLEGME